MFEFLFLLFDMMNFVLDCLVFLRKLKYGVSSYIDLLSGIEFSCVSPRQLRHLCWR